MKMYLAIFAAVLFASAVTGAPSVAEDEGRWFNFKCVGNILKEDVSAEVKELWLEYQKKLKQIHDTDWVKCKELDNVADQEKCKGAVILKSLPIYSEFFKKMVKIADWEKVKEIRKKISEKCVREDAFGVEMMMFDDEFTPDMGFDLFSLFESVAFGDKHSDYWLNLKCAWGVMAEEVSQEIKDLYAEYKEKMADVKVEFGKCKKIDNVADQKKCMVGVMEKGIELFFDFMAKGVKVAKWETVHKIQKLVHDKCVKHDSVASEDVVKASVDITSWPDKFQCFVDVFGDVSQRNNLAEQWEKYHPEIQMHLDEWKKCADLDNKFQRIMCNIKEGFKVVGGIAKYAHAIKLSEKPELMKELSKQLKEKCGSEMKSEDFVNLNTDVLTNGFTDKIKCVKGAIEDAMKESDFSEPWNKLKEDLGKLGDRIKACKEDNFLETAKCVANEIKGAMDDIKSFLGMVKKMNKDTYERAMKYIKERCTE